MDKLLESPRAPRHYEFTIEHQATECRDAFTEIFTAPTPRVTIPIVIPGEPGFGERIIEGRPVY